MADERQQPVAIRVTRPYATPDEFLEYELETLTRTSVTLIGAQPRPKGVILRFEVALASGGQLLRGEGRVVGYKENALGDQAGLVLRFTRLDTKSKALVDRAAAIREERARAALQAAMGEDSAPPPPMPSSSGSLPPGSLAPHSIGPMSVPNLPSSREPSVPPHMKAQSAPPQQPQFETPRWAPNATAVAPPPAASSSPSFDESTFSSPPDSPPPETAANPPSIAPPPESSPTVADGRLQVVPRKSEPAPAPRQLAPLPQAAPEREPLLAKLRDRARGLSADKLNALVRR